MNIQFLSPRITFFSVTVAA